MKIKKTLWLVLGFIALGFGALGAVLPFIPSFPFLLLAAWAFGRSSERLERWFKGTKLYKENLESFTRKEGMSIKTKAKLILTVTLLIGFGFFMMRRVPIGRIVLATVWIIHIVYFGLFVKTKKNS